MRLQIRTLSLIGGNREVTYEPGLNVVTGPITTGKTTLLQLTRLLLTSRIHMGDFPPEVKENVTGLTGFIEIGNQNYALYRPFVSTLTAPVEVASRDEALMLPSAAPSETSDLTYDKWLLAKLELPDIRVPRARTQPESESSPVTINDYHLYCMLTQDEIDNDVFGARNPFTDIKRRYVFEIIYGVYDIHVAQLQERFRQVSSEIRQLDAQTTIFSRFLEGTALANRAALLEQLAVAQRAKDALDESHIQSAATASSTPIAARLRGQIQKSDLSITECRKNLDNESRSIEELVRLQHQLQAQIEKLTRAIVSGEILIDFEFVICPRCGSSLDRQDPDLEACSLCLQVPTAQQPDKSELIVEQERLSNQLRETKDLVDTRRLSTGQIEETIATLETERSNLSTELDFELRSYISDAANKLREDAAKRAAVQAEVQQLEEYLKIYNSLDQAHEELQQLRSERNQLEAAIDAATSYTAEVEHRIQILEQNFQSILDRFKVPQFDEPMVATIDRKTYLPNLSGRTFRELSSQGLKVIVNVALVLAHQLTSIQLNLGLPQVLFIDGLTSNLGHEGTDLVRVNAMYDYLIELSELRGNDLQIIVADNDVPMQAQQYVRVRFDEDNRLIRQG